MQLVALCHTKMAKEVAAFWAAVSSTVESVLQCLPRNTACAEVVGELAAELQKVDGHHSKLKRLAARICDLLLRPPPGQA
jgi:hypothetical protein